MQNGMLMKNTPRQLRYSENVPPTNGPSAVPIAAKPSTTPMARAWRAPGERARHDGDRHGKDERGADAVHDARDDEVPLVGRGAADERHDAEDARARSR